MALRNWTGALDDYLAHVSDLAVKQGANSAEVKKLIHTYTEPNSRERRLADSAVSLCAAWELEHGGRPREPTRLPPDMMNTGSPIRYVAAGAAAGIVFVLALGLSVIVPWHESSINEVKSSIEEAVAGKTATMRDALAAEQSRVRELEQRVVIAQSELQAEVKEAEARAVAQAVERVPQQIVAQISANATYREQLRRALLGDSAPTPERPARRGSP